MSDTATKVQWSYTVDMLEVCNCNYACGCNFAGFPTSATGGCTALIGNRIVEGRCGDVDLAGAVYAMAVSWPGAIHEGGGTAAVVFDPSTTEAQREAIGAITTNEYGGMPWEILAGSLTEVVGIYVEPIELVIDGTNSSMRIGDFATSTMEPFRGPVEPHEVQEVHIVLPTGFIWQDASVGRGSGFQFAFDGFRESLGEDHWACYARATHHN